MHFSVYHLKLNDQLLPGEPHILKVPRAVLASFEDCLVANSISANIREHYMKWLGFHLDFCWKYRHDANNSDNIIAFQKKLLEKRKSERQQASHAILYLDVIEANPVSRSPSILSVSTVNTAENVKITEALTSSIIYKSPLGHCS